jgi:hypothetical protein
MKRFLIAAVVLVICTAAAQAQMMPPGKWWQRPEVVRELQITNDQQDRLDAIFRDAANELIDSKASVEKLQIAIRAELDRPQMRKAELQRIATQLSDARGKLFERELMMLVDMRSVLNEQQWTRMKGFLDRMHEQRDGRRQGPGGQGPPRRRP